MVFVLYDLRVAYKHLIPTEDQIETKASCVQRLGSLADASLAEIYEELTGRLREAVESMKDAAVYSRPPHHG